MMPSPSLAPGLRISRARSWPPRRSRKWARLGTRQAPDVMLSAIPSLPRAVLARLTEKMIDHVVEIDGVSNLEDGRHEGTVNDV